LLGLRSAALDRLASGDPGTQDAIEQLRDGGIEVVALTGDPSWVEHDDMPHPVVRIFEIVSRRQLFQGLDLDVEPHALPDWRAGGEQRQRLMAGHVVLFETIARHARGLPLGAALHPIYARMTLPDGRNYLEALCHTIESASLMAYRNRPAATIDWSERPVAIFERMKMPWRSGVLVHPAKEANISYAGREQSAFMADMVALDRQLQSLPSSSSYRGLIFEDYKGLRSILHA
jgi:hypothetical protein